MGTGSSPGDGRAPSPPTKKCPPPPPMRRQRRRTPPPTQTPLSAAWAALKRPRAESRVATAPEAGPLHVLGNGMADGAGAHLQGSKEGVAPVLSACRDDARATNRAAGVPASVRKNHAQNRWVRSLLESTPLRLESGRMSDIRWELGTVRVGSSRATFFTCCAGGFLPSFRAAVAATGCSINGITEQIDGNLCKAGGEWPAPRAHAQTWLAMRVREIGRTKDSRNVSSMRSQPLQM